MMVMITGCGRGALGTLSGGLRFVFGSILAFLKSVGIAAAAVRSLHRMLSVLLSVSVRVEIRTKSR